MKRRRLHAGALEAVSGFLFAAPVILGLLIWVIAPMIGVLLISLTDWNVLSTPHWIGIRNYVRLFTTDLYFWNTLKVTVYYVALNVVCTTVYALVVAMLLNQNIRGRSVYRGIFYLPTIIPVVASSALWLWLYNPDFGLLNLMLQAVGLPRSLWIFSQSTVVPSIVAHERLGRGGQHHRDLPRRPPGGAPPAHRGRARSTAETGGTDSAPSRSR